MRHIAESFALLSAAFLIVITGVAPAIADSSVCVYRSTSITGASLDPTVGFMVGLAYDFLPWPGGAQSTLSHVYTSVTSSSWGVIAASYVQYALPGFFVWITLGNFSPIGGTVNYWVCFS